MTAQLRSCRIILLAAGAAACIVPAAQATPSTTDPIIAAVRHNDCEGAVKLIKPEVEANDSNTTFLAGRMLSEGVCVKKDPAAATPYFARAADLGNHNAEFDYAAKVGLGEGTGQDYERAGILCREAGIDPKSQLQTYALGYACTLGTVTAQTLRETLPRGAFQANSGALVVAFKPGSAQLRIRSTPRVSMAAAQTGSNLRSPMIDAKKEVEDAWRKAVAAAPKPDPAHLDDEAIELTLDVDMTLEGGQQPGARSGSQSIGTIMMGGEMRRESPGGN